MNFIWFNMNNCPFDNVTFYHQHKYQFFFKNIEVFFSILHDNEQENLDLD